MYNMLLKKIRKKKKIENITVVKAQMPFWSQIYLPVSLLSVSLIEFQMTPYASRRSRHTLNAVI